MPALVREPDCVTAWRSATVRLLDEGQIDNLLVTMDAPLAFTVRDFDRWAPSRINGGARNQRNVANTIFPGGLYARSPDRESFYARYTELDNRARHFRRNRGVWGTYFSRFIDFGDSHVNQLDVLIDKLQRWQNVARAALVAHTSSAETDSPRTRGGPCLQMIELLQPSRERLDIVAIYRSQDYYHRALGNFVGLSSLLNFFCQETGRTPGSLTVHAIHAFFAGPARQARAFLAGE